MTKKRRLIYQINMARHVMMKAMDSVCINELDTSVVQLTALMVLNEQKSCQMKDLAHTLMLDKSAVTSLARRLQDKGLIEKMVSDQDSRASVLTLTLKGRQKLQGGLSLLHDANKIMNEGFSESELDTVSKYLDHLTDVFSKRS